MEKKTYEGAVIANQLYVDGRGIIRPLHSKDDSPKTAPTRPWWGLPTLNPRTAKLVGTAVTLAIAAVIILAIMIEWVDGCGEVTYKTDRTWVSNECVFQDKPITRGKW